MTIDIKLANITWLIWLVNYTIKPKVKWLIMIIVTVNCRLELDNTTLH